MDEVFRLLREQEVDASPDQHPLDLADIILDHADRFQPEQRLIYMLGIVLIQPFDRLCREHLNANCLMLYPVELAEAAIASLVFKNYLGRREKPLRVWVRRHIAGVARNHAGSPDLFLWQPDAEGSEHSRLLHVACGVINKMPSDARRIVRLAWMNGQSLPEIEALTGHHPEESERIIHQVLAMSYRILEGSDGTDDDMEEDGDGDGDERWFEDEQ